MKNLICKICGKRMVGDGMPGEFWLECQECESLTPVFLNEEMYEEWITKYKFTEIGRDEEILPENNL